MINYVTFDGAGNLTGGFVQAVAPEHASNHIVVSPEVQRAWTAYRANAARNGVERIPAAPAGPTVPEVVPMLNAHLVMIQAGWMPEVEAHIAAMEDEIAREQARAFLHKALTMRRDNALVEDYRAAKGRTHAEIDAMFIAAAQLEV